MKTITLLSFLFFGCGTAVLENQQHQLAGTLWVQKAAENRALYYQAFNIARHRLDIDLRYHKSKKPRAIIVDIDETILNNSPYQAENIMGKKSYTSASWFNWIKKSSAKTTAGSLEFLRYVAKKGVEIFYISNRKVRGFHKTYQNLKKEGFPVKKKNLLLKTTTSHKSARRSKVLIDYRVVLLMGDNLGDFSDAFNKKSIGERFAKTDLLKSEFGKKFIMLPNPMYGEWLNAIYKYKHDLSFEKAQKYRLKELVTK